MNSREITLVQETFEKVRPQANDVARLFYSKLFELDPSLRPLFRPDLTEQGAKLMQVLGIAVAGLRNLDALLPVVEELGRRHTRYGVKEEHYETVGVALMQTLQAGLGESFTPEVAGAWQRVYAALSTTMIEAAAAETLPAPVTVAAAVAMAAR
jgi:hemoglobin-like flavoprotein